MSAHLKTTFRNSPEVISGRTRELRSISDALLDQERSGTSLIVINGPAGIGKTTLINTALASYNDTNCFKLYGKFENRENTPYLAFRQAFESWSRQILLLPDKQYDLLKENATSALQTNIAAVTGVFKELEVFFSRKNAVAVSDHQVQAHQVQARLYYFLKKFFRSITSSGYRLIFFLDDLQWSDKASLLLLEELVSSNEVPGLLFITASRSSDEKLKKLKGLPNASFTILKPLSRTSVGTIIPPEWNFSKQNLTQFRSYLWLESGGNPFQIQEILKIIQRENPSVKAEDPNFWATLPRLGSEKNSVDFMRTQLRNLPFHQLKVIAAASCLGYSFNEDLLNKILIFPKKEISGHLSGLVKMQFLIKRRNTFIFTHDTVFSAANALLSNAEKRDLHQRIGHYFLQEIAGPEDHVIFLAVNHLNSAHNLSGSVKVHSNEHLLLNIQAGKLAIKNTAFETAHEYFAFAEKLFGECNSAIKVQDSVLREVFKKDEIDIDTLRFLIWFGFAETSFLLQKFDIALNYVRQILEIDCNRHQRLQATLLKMMVCSALIYQKNDHLILLDGIGSLEEMLGHYGICIPAEREEIKRESAKDCQVLITQAADLYLHVDFAELINPDEEYHDLMNLVTTSMTLMYFVDPYKALYMVSKTLLLTFNKGFAPLSPVLFAASFFTGFFSEKNRDLAFFLGKLALKMIEKEPFKRHSYMVHYIAMLNFFPWENHHRDCVKKLEEGVVQALEAGDRHYVSFCKTIVRMTDTYRGKNLFKHIQDCAKEEEEHHVYFVRGTDNAISGYLTGQKEGFAKGDFRFPEEIIADSEFNLICRYNYLVAREKLNYFANFFDAALTAAKECEVIEYAGKGYQLELEHYFFYSLSLLQCAYRKSEELAEALIKVEPKLKELRRLSDFKSGNYLHKVYLIEAEIAKCSGDFEQATLLYDLAIDEAGEQEFVHYAAIAAERAFEYYRDKNRMKQAKHYLKKCLKYYNLWGAFAKVEQLNNLYPEFILKKKRSSTKPDSDHYLQTIRQVLEQTVPGKQLSVKNLAEYLLSLILKEEKVKKAAILLFQENNWKLLALAPDEAVENKSLNKLKENLPVSILNYSIKKGEKIVLQDLAKEALFAADPYLQKEQPGNLCIFPVRQSGETIGIIYLEDCLISSEPEKELFLVIMELISTTFANAVYYHNNNALNKELKLQEKNRIEAVIESQEKERQRVARDLHDSLGQILALSRIKLSGMDTGSMEINNRLLLDQVVDLIDESCREIRTISHDLMPPDLKNKTLPEILENLINKNRQINGVDYKFHSHILNEDLSEAAKFTLYRVLQEILQNIIKHASASKVTISLTQNSEFINLLVEDNGKGFDTGISSLGIGLKNIYSRIKLLHGYFDIDSSINIGTVFNISIPLKV